MFQILRRVAAGRNRFAWAALCLAVVAACTEPRDTSGLDGGGGGVDDDGSASVNVPEGGSGGPAVLTLDTSSHDYGLVLVGMASGTAAIDVSNGGSTPTGKLDVTLTGTGAGFALATDDCSDHTLAGGASCRVVVAVTPTAAGTVSAQLTISANPGGMQTVALTAQAIAPGALVMSPTMQDFGMVIPPGGSGSQTFIITNTGPQTSGTMATTFVGSDASDFQITADGCAKQTLAFKQTCAITVRFAPAMTGPKSVSLKVAGDPGGSAIAQLSGSAITAGSVVVTPDSNDFGSIQQGMAGTTTMFTVQNKGQTATRMLATGVSASDFKVTADNCTGMTLAGNATCSVTVAFMPTTGGSKLGTLSVTEMGGGSAVSQLSGKSLANASLKVAPTTGTFNSVTIGATATVTFQVSNVGDVVSSVPTASIGGTAAAEFSIPTDTNGCTAAIKPGDSCMIAVRFAPASMGAKGATLTVAAPAGGSTTAMLTGTGITPGVLAINPSSFDFKGVPQGTMSPAASFVVSNSGQAATSALAVSIIGAPFIIMNNSCDKMTLAPTATCTITVNFLPAAPGPVSGTLQVVAGTNTTTASLTGQGLAPPSLVITPTTFTFGATVVGATSASQTFTVQNTGGVAASMLTSALTRTDMADFTILSSDCTATLGPGAMCSVVVAFAPKTAGSKSASVSVTATPGGSAAASLAGTAQNGARLTLAAATGSSANFGNVVMGSSLDETFVVTNSGQQASSAVGVTLTTGTSSGFTLLAPAAGECVSGTTTLAGGGSCNVRVRFAPMGAGAQTATLGASATTGGSAALPLMGGGQLQAGLTGTTSNNYGTVLVGTTSGAFSWKITNGGGVATGVPALTNSNSSEVIVGTNTCTAALAGGASCTIAVSFKPSAAGARTGTLTVSANPGGSVTFTASANGQTGAGLALAPATGSSTNFGNVLVGSTADETFTLTNSGQQTTSAITVSLTLATGSGFTIVTPGTGDCVSGTTTLAGNASCTIRVRFTSVAGVKSVSLGASATTGGTATALTLTANGQRPAALTGTTSNNYNTVLVGSTSSSVTWTLTNGGDVATGVPALTNSNTTEVIVGTNTCTAALAGGATCMIGVSFKPSASGTRTGTVTLAATPGGSVTFTATATGQNPAKLSLAATAGSSTNYGNVAVGSSLDESFTLTNTGGQAAGTLMIALTTATGSGFAVPAPTGTDCVSTTPLAGGASCTIRVRFTASASGAQTATLSASASPGGASPSLSLTATGQRPATLTGTPPSNNYGTILVGNTSGTVVFTVTNGGDLASGAPATTNTNPTEVVITSNTCTAALAAGAKCTMSVAFKPSASGTRSGTVTVSATPGGSVTFMAMATGQAVAALSLAPAAGSSAAFGTVAVGSSVTETFTVTNTGQQGTTPLMVTLTTATGSGFTLVTAPTGTACVAGTTTLAGGMTCNIGVRFTASASASGLQTASLTASAATGGTTAAQALSATSQRPAALAGSTTNSYGNVVVGTTSAPVTWTIVNNGDVATSVPTLTNNNTAEVITSGNTCTVAVPAHGSCSISVAFKPSGPNTRTGMLTLAATTGGSVTFIANAVGLGAAAITLAVTAGSSTSFGNVLAGSTKDESFTVTNTGAQATGGLTIALTPASGSGFTLLAPTGTDCVQGAPVPSGGCTVRVRFTASASAAGAKSVSLGVSATPGGTGGPLTLTATAQLPATLSPATMTGDFGNVPIGMLSSNALNWTVTNTGDLATGTLALTTTAEVFAGGSCIGAVVPAHGSCTMEIRFIAAASGARSGTATLTATPGGTVRFMATGTGVNPPMLVLAPAAGSSTDFGTVNVGAFRNETFTVTNTGALPPPPISFSVSGADYSIVTGGTCASGTTVLAGGASCTIVARFTPTVGTVRTATLTVAAGSGFIVSLGLTGTGHTGATLVLTNSVGVPYTSFDYGTLILGPQNSAAMIFVVENFGLQASGAVIPVVSGEGFAVTNNFCINPVQSGGNCEIEVTFTPPTEGTFSGSVSVTTTPGGSSPVVPLTGAALF